MKKLTTHEELLANVGKRVGFLAYGKKLVGILHLNDFNNPFVISDTDKFYFCCNVSDITLLEEPDLVQEQYIPKFGERALFSDTNDEYAGIPIELNFVTYDPIERLYFSCSDSQLENMRMNRSAVIVPFRYCKPLEKKTLTLTKQQIAEKYGVDEVVIEE